MPTVPNRAEPISGTVSDDRAAAPLGRHGSLTDGHADPPPCRGKNPARSTWLSDHIAQNRRTAKPRLCRHCGTRVLVGPDADACFITATVDALAVDPLREVVALLSGSQSYDLIRGKLYHRQPEHIHALRNMNPIHLEHQCGEHR